MTSFDPRQCSQRDVRATNDIRCKVTGSYCIPYAMCPQFDAAGNQPEVPDITDTVVPLSQMDHLRIAKFLWAELDRIDNGSRMFSGTQREYDNMEKALAEKRNLLHSLYNATVSSMEHETRIVLEEWLNST